MSIYRYSLPVTFTGDIVSGEYLRCTIPDWGDLTSNLRSLTSGDDVRVFRADTGAELARDFSAGTLTFQAPANGVSAYTICFGKSDAGSPASAGFGLGFLAYWDVTYTADVVPAAADPVWGKTQVGAVSESAADGRLSISTTGSATCYYTRAETGHTGHVCAQMIAAVTDFSTNGAFAGAPYLQIGIGGNGFGQVFPKTDMVVTCANYNGSAWVYADITVDSLGSADHYYGIWWDDSINHFRYYLDSELIYTSTGTEWTANTTTIVRFGDGDSTSDTAVFSVDCVQYAASAPAVFPTATFGLRTLVDDTISLELQTSCTSGDTGVGLYGASATEGIEYAQCFQVDSSGNLGKVRLPLKCQTDSRPADVSYSEWTNLRIETDNAGKPSGVCLGSLRIPYCILPTMTTGYLWKTFVNRSNTELTGETDYWLVLSVPLNTASNRVYWERDDTSPSYVGGISTRSRAAGVWGNWSAKDTAKSFLFEIYVGFYGAPALPDVGVTADREPYLLPSDLPSDAAQDPPSYGINGLLEENDIRYFASWFVDEGTANDSGISSVMVSDDGVTRAVSSTLMLDGVVDGTAPNDLQKRVTALWKDDLYRGIATYKHCIYDGVDETLNRRMHHVSAATLMNTEFTDDGELTLDVTSPFEHKFGTRFVDGAEYLYFDISCNKALYETNGVKNAKPVRGTYDGSTAVTDLQYVEWDMDGIDGDVAQAWAHKTQDGGYVGFISAQWASENYYAGTVYYTRSNDGIVWSPCRALVTLGPEGATNAAALVGDDHIHASASTVALFVAGDYLEIQGNTGSERAESELRCVATASGTTLALTANLAFAHASGRRIGRIDANYAIIYSADFSDTGSAEFWGYTAPSEDWIASGGGNTFWGVYAARFSGDLSALLSVSSRRFHLLPIPIGV